MVVTADADVIVTETVVNPTDLNSNADTQTT